METQLCFRQIGRIFSLSIKRVLPASGPDFRVGVLIFLPRHPPRCGRGNNEHETGRRVGGRLPATGVVRALARERGGRTRLRGALS